MRHMLNIRALVQNSWMKLVEIWDVYSYDMQKY